MATYTVLQDVEAEDKLLGPLSLRQFIYAGAAAIGLYLSYFLVTHKAGFLIVLTLPVALVAGFFAFPWGRDQPTEVWALAKIRFLLLPRRRIWNQSGAKELVTITAPKHVTVDFTNGLSQVEVRSRLRALADTIDSRGWAIKNANLNLYGQQALIMAEPSSDRLLAPSALPQPVDGTDIQAADDILDERNNAGAQRLDSMISQSAKAHHDKIVEDLQRSPDAAPKPAGANNYWFLNQPAPATNIPNDMVTFNTQVVTPGGPTAASGVASSDAPAADEATLVAELDARKQQMPGSSFYGHLHTIAPISAQQQAPSTQPSTAAINDSVVPQTAPLNSAPTPVVPSVTPASQAAILSLASNDDLDVATIAREAERNASQNEVVIKLH